MPNRGLMQGFICIMITYAVMAGRPASQNTSAYRPGNGNISRCDARTYLCRYPYECMCFWRLHLLPLRSTWYHYSSITDECIPVGEQFNCNGFPTKAECQRSCSFSRPTRRRPK